MTPGPSVHVETRSSASSGATIEVEVPAFDRRPRRPIIYIIPVLGLMVGAVLTTATLVTALQTVGGPFAGFFYYPNGLVSTVQRERWPGMLAGIRPRDRVIAVGDRPIRSGRELGQVVRGMKVGEILHLTIERPGPFGQPGPSAVLSIGYPIGRWAPADFAVTFGLPWSIGAFYLLMGAVIFWIKRTRVAALMLGLCGTIAVFYTTTFDVNTSFWFKRVWEFYPLLGAISFHLFACFPEERPRLMRSGIIFLPYVGALGLIGIREVYLDHAGHAEGIATATTAFLVGMFVFDLLVLWRTWSITRDPVVRNKAKLILLTVLSTTAVGVFWALAARIRPTLVTLESAMSLSAFFPVLMAYAVLRQNLFDMDRVVKASLIYGGASALLIALYFSAVTAVSLLGQKLLDAGSTTVVAVLSTLGVALAFHPVRVRLQGLVDHLFYRREVDLRRALIALTQQLSQVADVSALGELVAGSLAGAFDLTHAVLLVIDERRGALRVAGLCCRESPRSGPVDDARRTALRGLEIPLPERLASGLGERPVWGARELLRASFLDENSQLQLARLEAELLVPLGVKGQVVGLLALGPFRPDPRGLPGPIDPQLLEGVSAPVAIATENAILYTERAQRERLAALGHVSAVMVHEIKNPIGIIQVSIGTIKKKLRSADADNAARELCTFIEQEVQRMNQTIGKILTFARPQVPSLGSCDVHAVIRTTVALVTLDLEAAQVRVTTDLSPEVTPVAADPDLLQQVLLNLVLNAKAAMPEGGELRVLTRPGGRGGVEITVQDSGVGMDEATRERLFQPFFSTRAGGTGLGLAIVKQILDEHRGSIRVESQPGHGSRFTVVLPG